MTMTPQKERGVAAIEFALVFTLVFGVFWALVSYTFPLILLQTMNRAVAEAVRVGAGEVARTGDSANEIATYKATVTQEARDEIAAQMTLNPWLPARWTARLTTGVTFIADPACPASNPSCVLEVVMRYPNYTTNPIVPILSLPVIGQVPRLPATLEARASLAL